MQINRRYMLGGLGAAALAGAGGRVLAQVTAQLGGIEVTSVSDGHLVLPGSFFFDGLPQEELSAILSRHGISSEEVMPPCNVTLMRDGDRTVLFDVGSGPGFMPTVGKLPARLDALGVAPEDITHVIFTHCHPDHLWGVLDDFDDPVFPEADYLIGQAEFDYWRDPATVDTIGEARASFAVGAARRLDAIAERCSFVRDGQEVLPGLMAHATFGHTPGHMSFEIRDGSDALMVIGDAVTNAHVALARPDWHSGSDQDAEQGAETRLRLLDMLATDRIPLIGFHLPDGGHGWIERRGDSYDFIGDQT